VWLAIAYKILNEERVCTIQFGDEISKMKHLDHGKVTGVLLKELLLLILSYRKSAFVRRNLLAMNWLHLNSRRESFGTPPFEAIFLCVAMLGVLEAINSATFGTAGEGLEKQVLLCKI